MGRKVEIDKPPRTQLRNGRWFWECTKAIAALGFERSIPLGDDATVAFEKAKEWNKRVEAAKAGVTVDGEPRRTVKELIKLYKKTDEYIVLGKATKTQYNSVLGQIEAMAGHVDATGITRKGLKKTFKIVKKKHGHAQAVNHIRLWRLLFETAMDEEWRSDNPARFKIKHPKKRTRVWFEHEFEAFCKKAVEVGRRSLMRAALIARDMGPRRFDVCRLGIKAYDPRERFIRYRENKQKKVVEAKVTERLAAELDQRLLEEEACTQLVVCESTKRPYTPTHLSHEVARVRRLCGLEQPEDWDEEKDGKWKPAWWDDEVLGDYKPPTFHDLRRSLQTELTDAGANRDLRGAQTGQAEETLSIYTVPTRTQSAAAIELLETHRAKRKKPPER